MTTSNQGASTIEPVSVSDLGKKDMDPRSAELLRGEAEYIHAWRKKTRPDEDANLDEAGNLDNLCGIALSGGGIRSATFALGILQALAGKDLLKRFDYLSTVSGGGYIGSSLTWLLSDKANKDCSSENPDHVPFGIGRENFPYGADDPRPMKKREDTDEQRSMRQYLRQHGNYLSPGKGISALSLIGVTVRGTVLNLLVWMPLFIAVFLAGFTLSSGIAHWKPKTSLLSWLAETEEHFPGIQGRVGELLGYELFLWLGLLMIAISLLITIIYSLATFFRRGRTAAGKKFWYDKRRWIESLSSWTIPITVLLFAIGSLPIVASFLTYKLSALGPLAIIGGFTTALRSFLKSVSSEKNTQLGILVPVGAVLFLYGVFVLCFQIAFYHVPDYPLSMAIVFLVSVATGLIVNLNYISPHRYYRDRLMETFMPDIANAEKNVTGSAKGADSAAMQDISNPDNADSLYHIVNTNVVLVNSDAENTNYKMRGGDNFILSPLYCGSSATGWCPTKEFMDGKMTLATAVAISGAAANPNAGVGGEGLTRNKFLSLVMSLLNLRLGYWAHNPLNAPKYLNPGRLRSKSDDAPRKRTLKLPNHFWPGGYSFLNAVGGCGFTEKRSFIQLSDGGHFENTAIYELIRRRCRLVLASDAGADPKFSFSDLQTLNQRVQDDFGAEIKIIPGYTPDEIMPRDQDGYPQKLPRAKRGYMLAVIKYADDSKGLLVFLKTTLLDKVTFKVKGYAAQHPDFPDQSTGDQFFDAIQVEAYRELGFQTARQMAEEINLEDIMRDLNHKNEENPIEEFLKFS